VSSFHFHHISSSFLFTPLSLATVHHVSSTLRASVSPSYISCFIVFLLHLLLVYYIIMMRHHVMILTLLHHMSSVLSKPYHSHSFSHLNVLVCLILATFSYPFLFYSQEIFSLILDLFLVSLPSIYALLTSGLSQILSTIPLLLLSSNLLKLGSLRTLPLLNYLMLFLVDSPSLTLLVLFLIHALL